MFKRIPLFGLVLLVCFSCKKQQQIDGYSRDKNGFYYKLLAIGDGNEKPQRDQIVVLDALMKTQSDSVFWDTRHDAMNGLYVFLNSQLIQGSCNSYFLSMVEGDSASFLIKPSILFKNYFDTIVPDFCKRDSLMYLNVRVSQIISKPEYDALKNTALGNEVEDTELQELKRIDQYLRKNYSSVKADANGIYTLQKTVTSLEPVAYGKKVKIAYQGMFLDGTPADHTEQSIEYTYGTPDQLVKGLNIVIGSLKKGETTKIILPSRLAFGESGSSNGSIPPYTSLVYNIKIIDIK
jgi:FKBP-type peptidyl-prolyl cis-trans isomerase FkpA